MTSLAQWHATGGSGGHRGLRARPLRRLPGASAGASQGTGSRQSRILKNALRGVPWRHEKVGSTREGRQAASRGAAERHRLVAGRRPTNFVRDIERASAQPAALPWAHAVARAAAERAQGTDAALVELQAVLLEEASSGGVGGALWRALRGRDRDASGRLTAAEFGAALASARVRFHAVLQARL